MAELVPLAALVTLQRGQSYQSALLDGAGPFLLGLGTIQRNGGFRRDSLRTYGGDTPTRIRLKPGDLYVSLKDVTHAADLLGAVARVPPDVRQARLTQDTIRLDVIDALVDPLYLYWTLRDPAYRAYCRAHGTGTTNLDLSQTDFLAYPVALPPIREQRAIADVLGALDDKIAANARLLTVADHLVRAEWESMVFDSAETVPLAHLTSGVREQVQPSRAPSGAIYVGLEHVPRHQMWLDSWGEVESVTSTKASFAKGDVLFGKLRPYFHKVVSAPSGGICSTDIIVLRPQERALAGFVLAAASSDNVVQWASASSAGTRMPRTSWKDLSSVDVPWPGASAAREFSARVDAIRVAAEARIREDKRLAAMRDALLPALMSGRLRVRDAVRIAEQAS